MFSLRKIGLISILVVLISGFALSFFALMVKENTNQVQSSWDGFEELNSRKFQALVSLRRELGYGGAIHNLKNYVLRRDPEYLKRSAFHLGAAENALRDYRTLVSTYSENLALDDIGQTISKYQNAIFAAESLDNSGTNSTEMDRVLFVDDGKALSALERLSQITHPGLSNHVFLEKVFYLNNIRKDVGYGGMIHNFKNYVLRKDPALKEKVQSSLESTMVNIEKYLSLPVTEIEKLSLNDLKSVLAQYAQKLPLAERLIQEGLTPEEIDQMVIVDDKPAFDGLAVLFGEIIKQSSEEATEVAGKFQEIYRITNWQFIFVITTSLLLVFGGIYIIQYRFLHPLQRLKEAMSQITNGKTGIEVPEISRDDEIGEMAIAIDGFRKNAIAKMKAEEDLRASEAKYSGLLEIAPEAIIAVDEGQLIRVFNNGAEDIFGYKSDEVIGEPLEILIPEKFRKGHPELVSGFVDSPVEKKKLDERGEILGLRKNGEEFPAQGSISKMSLGGESLFSIILQDITHRKEAEDKVLNAIHKAEVANRAKSQFLSNMSHELRTPLNAILGFSSIMKDPNAVKMTEEQLLQYSEYINNSGKHLLEIVNNILDLSKIESGETVLEKGVYNPVKILDRAIQVVSLKAQKKNIEVKCFNHAPKVFLDVDKRCLKQMLANLLSNAVKFSNENNKIEIDMDLKENGKYEISVRDFGIGIDNRFLEEIMQPFQKTGFSLKTETDGAGLGLPLVRSLMELHNGEVIIQSEKNEGTKVTLLFPSDSVVKEQKKFKLKVVK